MACLNREYGEVWLAMSELEMRVSRFEFMHGCEIETVGVHSVLFSQTVSVWSLIGPIAEHA